jgi:hypothetical protein
MPNRRSVSSNSPTRRRSAAVAAAPDRARVSRNGGVDTAAPISEPLNGCPRGVKTCTIGTRTGTGMPRKFCPNASMATGAAVWAKNATRAPVPPHPYDSRRATSAGPATHRSWAARPGVRDPRAPWLSQPGRRARSRVPSSNGGMPPAHRRAMSQRPRHTRYADPHLWLRRERPSQPPRWRPGKASISFLAVPRQPVRPSRSSQ